MDNQHLTEKDRQILDQRAADFAKVESRVVLSEKLYIHFRLGDIEQFAIDYDCMDEIINPEEIVKIPGTAEHIAGVINRRSEILAVYDIKKLFGLKSKSKKNDNKLWVIIIRMNGLVVGFDVTEVYGNIMISEDEILEPLRGGSISVAKYIKGIIDGKISLLDMDVLMIDLASDNNDVSDK